jgi:RND superfamily putative drug exporter
VLLGVATIGLIVVLLSAIFRAPLAALLPLVAIGLVYAFANAVIAIIAKATGFEADANATSLLIVVLFGVGTDYVLFFLFRYRERLRSGDEAREAVRVSVERVGETIASSALVVICAFLALLLSRFEAFGALAPVLAVSLAVTLVAGVTLVPATVALIGDRLFWPSRSWRGQASSGLAGRLGDLVERRPTRVAAAATALLVALAVAAVAYKPNYNATDSLPKSKEAAAALKDFNRAFPPGAVSPTEVFVAGTDVNRSEVERLSARLRRVPGVAEVAPPVRSRQGSTYRLDVALRREPFVNASLDLVERRIRPVAHSIDRPGQGAPVGGETSAYVDVRAAINRDFSVVFPVAAVVIALILAVVLRAITAPLMLLAAVALGYVATLGASVLAFQVVATSRGSASRSPC